MQVEKMSSRNHLFENTIGKLKLRISDEINWEDKNLKLWKDLAEEKQIFYCTTLGSRTWEKYEEDEVLFLKLKIGFSLFGPQATKEDQSDDLNNYFDDPSQKKAINKIVDLIKNECKSEEIFIAFIFVIAWIDEEYSEFPIIRMLKEENEGKDVSYFIDGLGRLYKSWHEFLENNIFPKCIYCYPENGLYNRSDEGKILLEFGRSPQSRLMKRFLCKIDTVSTVAGLGSAAVGMASLAIPVAGPVILGATAAGLTTGLWSTGRTLASMADRKKHSQSLSLLDHEGRACWLSLAVNILGAASSGAIQYTQFIARNGKVLTNLSTVAINSLELGNISFFGLGIVNDIAAMIQNKNLNIKNCSELIVSILFFCHYTISFKTARDVVLDIQNRIIQNAESQLNVEEKLAFRSIVKEMKKCGEVEGNARVIKSLRAIENKESFFKNLLQVHKNAENMNSFLTFTEKGLIKINDTVEIHPSDFDRFSETSKENLLSTSKYFSDPCHCNHVLENLEKFSKNENLNLSKEISNLCKHLKVKDLNDFEINGIKIISSAKPSDIFILNVTVEIIEKQQNKSVLDRILKEVTAMSKNVTCNNILEFCALIQTVLKKYKEYKNIYLELKKMYEEIQSHFPQAQPNCLAPLELEEDDKKDK